MNPQAGLFDGLVRSPPTTIEDFVIKASTIERALQAPASQHNRLADTPVASTLAFSLFDEGRISADNLREMFREIAQEFWNILPDTDCPTSISIAEVVREEVHRALQQEAPISVAVPEEPTLTYAAAA